MSRRTSERKAKTAASHFLKRLTGADDYSVNQSASNKRKLVFISVFFLCLKVVVFVILCVVHECILIIWTQ